MELLIEVRLRRYAYDGDGQTTITRTIPCETLGPDPEGILATIVAELYRGLDAPVRLGITPDRIIKLPADLSKDEAREFAMRVLARIDEP